MKRPDPEMNGNDTARRMVVNRAILLLISRNAGAGRIITLLRKENVGWEESNPGNLSPQLPPPGFCAGILIKIVANSILSRLFAVETATRYYPCIVETRVVESGTNNGKT